jgi:hypothetical protein
MPEKQSAPDSWSGMDKEVIQEVVRQAELQIQHQALIAQSLDQRATSIAALTNAGAVALLVFFASKAITDGVPVPLGFCTLTIAVAWFASACCAINALKPGPWLSAGTWPHQWYEMLQHGHWKQEELLGSIAEQLDDNCRKNHARNIAAAAALKLAIWLGMLSPLFGIISFWAGPALWKAVLGAPAL